MLGIWSRYVVPDFDKTRLMQLPAAAIHNASATSGLTSW